MTDKIHEAAARAAHEVNRAYCLALGDTSQPSWDKAPEWQRTSALNGVAGVVAGNTPKQSHESWSREKLETGWKYGPEKLPSRKEHPCLVAYEELPEAQRRKDALYIATVQSIISALA